MNEKIEKLLKAIELAELDVNPNLDGPSDPVHFHEEKWWFWDEIWANRIGPFDTEKEAREEIKRYCKEVLGHYETDS